jgi:hypothetical protein
MRRAVFVITAIAVLAGCASSSAPSTAPSASSTSLGEVDGIPIPGPTTSIAVPVILAPTTCPSTAPAILSSAGKIGASSLTTKHSSHLLICTYTNVHPAAPACTKVEVEINTNPQAFQAFSRWAVETGQNSMWTSTPALNPRPVSGIGIEAEWVPAVLTFETATMNTWVAVFLSCPTRAPLDKPLAAALGKAGLATTA